MNLFTTGKLTNTRASTVSAFGFAGDTATKFEKDGQVYMNIRDANGGVGVDLCIDGSTMESIQDDIISTGFLVKRLGYTQTLAPHGWEGFVKTNSDGSVSRIPLTWSKKDSLWYFKYGFGPTQLAARNASSRRSTASNRRREPPQRVALAISEPQDDVNYDAKEWDDAQSVVRPTMRPREQKFRAMQRHRKMGHTGPCGTDTCEICSQVHGNHRKVYVNPTPVYDIEPGRTIHADSAYWDVTSKSGNRYTICAIDDCSAWMGGVHMALRSQAGTRLIQWVKSNRENIELNCPNFCRIIYLDPAGEWLVGKGGNVEFMRLCKEAEIEVRQTATMVDKRKGARGEMAVQMTKRGVQSSMLDTRLEQDMWEYTCEHAWDTHNLYPTSRHSSSRGRGPRPLELLSKGYVDREECDRRIEYTWQPGTLARVRIPGKHGGIADLTNSQYARVLSREGGTTVFQTINPQMKEKIIKSVHYAIVHMPPGIGAYKWLGLKTPVRLPSASVAGDGDIRKGNITIIKLNQLFDDTIERSMTTTTGITTHGDVPSATYLQIDASGTILEQDGDMLVPTGGFVHIIPAEKVTQLDIDRRKELWTHSLTQHPTWLIGRQAHKYIKEWRGVARGMITSYDPDEKYWSVLYDADDGVEEYDANDMQNWVIDNIDGKSAEDGGASIRIAAHSRAAAEKAFIDHDVVHQSAGDRGEQLEHEPISMSERNGDGVQTHSDSDEEEDVKYYTTQENEKWSSVRTQVGIGSSQADQREYLGWLREFKMGNKPAFKTDGFWFPSPIGHTKKSIRFDRGVKFPIAEGARWDKHSEAEHQAIKFLEEQHEYQLADTHNMLVEHVYILRAEDMCRKYCDEKGIPIPPKNMIDLAARPNSNLKTLWEDADTLEWEGLEERDCFRHGLGKQDLFDEGILPGKKIVGMQMLYDAKLKDGAFERAKARCVVQGHKGAIRKGIDYDTVFAAAPNLAVGRMMKCIAVLLGWTRFAFDLVQAYLMGKAEEDQQYPVRYPEGRIRNKYRKPKSDKFPEGEETYAIVIGNVYGIPTAGRVFAAERERLLLEVLPEKTGWSVYQCEYEPCMIEITTDLGRVLMNTHTDDCDCIAQHPDDEKRVIDECNKLFSHKGKDGVKVVSPNLMLGVVAHEAKVQGVRTLKIEQRAKCEEIYEKYKDERHGKKPPSIPFPLMSTPDHPEIDNDGRVVGVLKAESDAVHKKGFREVCGSLLWPTRNTTPMTMYAASMLSKCMSTPPESAWNTAMHTMHYMYTNRNRGITYSETGNLEPVCYYDSGFNQKKLGTRPQYSFVIFWAGAPIIWASKRHGLTPQSVSEAEFQCLNHAWQQVKYVRELLAEIGFGEWVTRPTLMIGDNRNARDWASERMNTSGNIFFDRRYWTVREQVKLGRILPVWIAGPDNPADVGTKSIDKPVNEKLSPWLCGEAEIPIPKGTSVLCGPVGNPKERAGTYG